MLCFVIIERRVFFIKLNVFFVFVEEVLIVNMRLIFFWLIGFGIIYEEKNYYVI